MKKLFSSAFILVMLLSTYPAQAGNNSGNYINERGCLVVWESYTLFGIRWSYNETEFCNNDNTPIILDGNSSNSDTNSFWSLDWLF